MLYLWFIPNIPKKWWHPLNQTHQKSVGAQHWNLQGHPISAETPNAEETTEFTPHRIPNVIQKSEKTMVNSEGEKKKTILSQESGGKTQVSSNSSAFSSCSSSSFAPPGAPPPAAGAPPWAFRLGSASAAPGARRRPADPRRGAW